MAILLGLLIVLGCAIVLLVTCFVIYLILWVITAIKDFIDFEWR